MSEQAAQFGADCRELLQSRPFGSLSKRELELGLLQAAIDAGLLRADTAALAASLQLSLTKANGYLNDLALRRPPLTDAEAVTALVKLLPICEVVPNDRYLSLPLHDASLRIWLERKLAANQLHPGESLRRDVVKLTPSGLLRLLDHAEAVTSPAQALDALDKALDGPPWLEDARAKWSPTTSWRDTLSTFESTLGIVQALPLLLGTVLGS